MALLLKSRAEVQGSRVKGGEGQGRGKSREASI